jgi:ribosomal protein S12 methylthiotransferase accessory factor
MSVTASALESQISYFASKIVSRKTGLLKGLRLLYRAADEAFIYTGIGELADTGVVFSSKGETSGTGVGQTSTHALMAAMGESLEGYSSYEMFHAVTLSTYEQFRTKGIAAVSPKELQLYSANQYDSPDFPFTPFGEELPIGWVKGYSLSTNEEKYLPAAQVYVSYKPSQKEKKICHTIFGGVASGLSYKRTLLSAIYETIERDAMMIWWLNQLPMERLRLDKNSECAERLQRITNSSSLAFETWKISMDIPVPVFFSLLTDKANGTVVGGFGTNLNPKTAFFKSIYECIQNRLGQLPMRHPWGRELYNTKIGFNVVDKVSADLGVEELIHKFSSSKNLYANLQFYLYPQTHACLDAVRSSRNTIDLGDIVDMSFNDAGDELEYCLLLLAKKGFDVIVTDLTAPDIAEMGFVNLRVNIPGLVPNSVCAWPFLGNKRLYDVPVALGFPRKEEAEMTRLPLPYA